MNDHASVAHKRPLRKLPSDQEVPFVDAWDPSYEWFDDIGAKDGEYTSKCFRHFIQPCDQKLREIWSLLSAGIALPPRQTFGV